MSNDLPDLMLPTYKTANETYLHDVAIANSFGIVIAILSFVAVMLLLYWGYNVYLEYKKEVNNG